jgi:sodium/proline symporter
VNNGTVILLTIVIYQVVLISLGVWSQRRTHDNEDFFLGGRQLGASVASISYAASSSSAWTLIGFTGIVYVMGLSSVWFIPGILLGHVIGWTWIAPRLMKASKDQNLLTVTDVLAGDVQGGMRRALVICASVFIVLSFTLYIAAQFHAAGTTFTSYFDISFEQSVLLGALIVLVYTFLGGFWAVSLTDTLQGILIGVVAVALPVAALIAVGGVRGLIEGLAATLTPDQLSLTGPNAALIAVGFILGTFGLGLGSIGQPQLLTRFMALRDEKALRQGRLIALTWFSFVFVGMFIVGLSAHVLTNNLDNPETLFFLLTNELFPGVMAGVVTAAVLSAIMSTADSQLLVAASAIAHDLSLSRRFSFAPLLVSRIVITVLCVMAIWITLELPSSIFDRATLAWSSLGAAFGPIIIARAFNYRSKPAAVLGAMIMGFCLTVVFHWFPIAPAGFFERIIPLGLSAAIVFGFPERRRVGQKESLS